MVTALLALGPITNVVRLNDPKWSLHADQRTGPHQHSLQPLRTLERAMNQATMEAYRVSCAHRDCEQHEKRTDRIPREVHGSENESDEHHSAVPQRSPRIPTYF